MRTYVVPVRRQVLDDGGVYREVYGDDDAPDTVVLVHGAGGTHVVWWQQLHALCDAGFRVVALDLPGFGRTPGPFDLPRCVDALSLVVDRPSHLVGQSLGGWVVSTLAARRPDDVRSVLYSATPGGIAEAQDLAREVMRNPTVVPDPDRLGGHAATGPAAAPDLAALYQLLGSLAASPDRREIGRALWDAAASAAELTCPVRFVSGAADAVFPPEVVAAAAAATGARHVLLDGCGHSPYFEDAAAWNAAALEWLGGRDSNPE